MEQLTILRKLGEKWREAAYEVAHPALKRCYVERAAWYERRSADEERRGRRRARGLCNEGGEHDDR